MRLKGRLKKILAGGIALLTLVMSVNILNAKELYFDSLDAAIDEYSDLAEVLTKYFDMREENLNNRCDVQLLELNLNSMDLGNSSLVPNEIERIAAISEIGERAGINILNAKIGTFLISLSKIESAVSLNEIIAYDDLSDSK